MLDKSTRKNEDRMCNIAIRNACMKQDDIARVLNVSQSVVSRPLKEHRVTVRLESGVMSPLDSLDGQNMVLRDDIARSHCTLYSHQ